MSLRAVFVAAAAALAYGCGATTEWTAHDFADRADKYAAEARYQAAAIEYRNAIKRQPEWAEAHRKLADILMTLGSFDAAFRAYREACTLAPGDTRSCLQTARLLLNAGMATEAQFRAQAVVDRAPADVDARLVLASAFARLGRISQAIRLLDEAIKIDHRPAAYAALGDVHAAAGDRVRAEAAFRSAVARSAGSPEARVNLARFLVQTERMADAEAELLEAIGSNPADELANRTLASLYVTTDRPEAAEPHLKRAAAQPNQQYRSLLALADFYAGAGRWDEARAALEQAPREGALATAAKVRLAAIEYETGDITAAHRTLDAVLKQRATAEAWTLQAQFLAREGRLTEALDAARAAIAIQPQLADAYRIIAAIEGERGNVSEAEEALRAAGYQ